MPSQAAAPQWSSPTSPKSALVWTLGFEGLWCPQPSGPAHSRGWRGRIFSHLFGLVLLGAPRLLTGAVGHRKQKHEGFQPSTDPGGTRLPRFLVKGERSAFHLAPEAFPLVSTGSSLSDIILPNREHRAGSALAEGDSKELNLGIPPLTNTFPLCNSMSIIPPTPKAKTL